MVDFGSRKQRRMTLKSVCAVIIALGLIAGPATAGATPITISFDSLDELSSVGTAVPGLTFLNATVLTAGSTINEFEFPPHSGSNLVFDDGGPISISFATPVFSIGGFVTYLAPLTFTAFDTNNNVVGTVTSLFASNLGLSGDPGSNPNELLQLISSTGIGSVLISADLAGGSFVLDDFRYDTEAPVSPTPVPEPATLLLFGAGVVGMVARRIRERCHSCG
jgi:hypothetical protein